MRIRVNITRICTCFLVLLLTVGILSACSQNEKVGETNSPLLEVQFYDGQDLLDSVSITNLNELIPPIPRKEGYDFICFKTEDGKEISKITLSDFRDNILKLYALFEKQTYIVSFDTNGGNKIESISATYGESPIIQEPEREGYSFNGWFKDDLLKDPFDGKVYNDITLFADWSLNSYSITYKYLGSEETVKLNYNQPITFKNEIKEGYTFEGWYEDNLYQKKTTLTNMPSKNITLYGKYNLNNYMISFDKETFGDVPSISLKFGEDIVLGEFKKNGYILEGLYLDKNFVNKFTYTKMPAKDLVLFGKFIPATYNVELHVVKDGVDLEPVKIIKYTYLKGLTIPVPLKKDYMFKGWYNNINLNGDRFISIGKDEYGDKAVYGTWIEGAKTLTYVIDGVNVHEDLNIPGTQYELYKEIKEGYTLNGWFKDSALTQKYETTIFPSENITLYAKWVKNKYNITFDALGYGNFDSVEYYYQDEILELPIPNSKEGYEFIGWFNGETKIDNGSLMPADNLSLIAKWDKIECSIEFVTNGGEEMLPIVGGYGDLIKRPKDPIKNGYKFVGWFSDKDLIYEYKFQPLDKFFNIKKILYAKWVRLISVTYYNEYGVRVHKDEVIINEYYDVLTPEQLGIVRPDYDFNGWFKDQEFYLKQDNHIVLSEDINIYGKWINKSFVPYIDKFNNGGKTRQNPLIFDNRNEFVYFLDYLSTRNITFEDRKYVKLSYIDYTKKSSYLDEYQKASLQMTGVRYDIVVAATLDLAEMYVGKSSDVITKTPNPKKIPKVYNGLTPKVSNPRPNDFDDFKCNNYPVGFNARTSNELFYLLEHGYKPLVVAHSPADIILNKAKEVLREICDDSMSDMLKMYAIYCWIQNNVYYDYTAIDIANNDTSTGIRYAFPSYAWHAEGVFLDGLAVCDGISKAVTILARIEGITCVRVISLDHAWNKVLLNINNNDVANWYSFDATWSYSKLGEEQGILLDNFLVTDDKKKELRGQEAINYLYINCTSEINPYECVLVEYNNKYRNLLISTDSELKKLINYSHDYINENNLDRIAINVNISFVPSIMLQEKINDLVKIINCFNKNDTDISCTVFVEENKYLISGDIIVILVEKL